MISYQYSWVSILLSLLCGLPGLRADTPPVWQPYAPLLLQSESHREVIDGIDSEWVTLSGQNFRARWFPGGDWLISSHRQGASLTFSQRVDTDLQMRLYLYPASDALGDFSESSLRAYATSIPAQFPGWRLVDARFSFESAKLGSLLLMDAAYRKVSYNLAPKDGVAESRYVCDLISILGDGRIFVLRFIGNERFIGATERDLSSDLGRFMVDG